MDNLNIFGIGRTQVQVPDIFSAYLDEYKQGTTGKQHTSYKQGTDIDQYRNLIYFSD